MVTCAGKESLPRSQKRFEVETDVLKTLVFELRDRARRYRIQKLTDITRGDYANVNFCSSSGHLERTISADNSLAYLRESF